MAGLSRSRSHRRDGFLEPATRVRALLSLVVDIRPDEERTVALMFAYAFAAMTAHNLVQPATRSTFISDLGAENIPYVLLATGVLIGFVMQLYTWVGGKLPERWALPIIQLGLGGMLLAFFVLLGRDAFWASSAFYLFGQILGALLLSQFWTLANEVYDPRQARRLFGFIGGGASLGGMAGSGTAALVSGRVGTSSLLLLSAGALVVAAGVVVIILRHEPTVTLSTRQTESTDGGKPVDTWNLIRNSPNLPRITLLISFAAIAAVLVDQQLSMAAEQFFGDDADAVTSFLASARFLLSAVALAIQMLLIKQIYRLLGVGFALLMLPVSLGLTASLILVSGALWAPTLASVVDRSIRYTVDRTTREIFFLPLESSVRLRVKSFIDVTGDRIARGVGAVVVLVVIQGFGLQWPQLSIVTLALVAVWFGLAFRARDQYVAAIRQGLETQVMKATDVRVGVADLTTVEALLEELAHPDERRVLYAIDVLESLDKHNLVTPLLLHHESPSVRARAVRVMGESRADLPMPWHAMIQRMVDDVDPEVRTNAILTLARVKNQDATKLARELMKEAETTPRMAISAAAVLAVSGDTADLATARSALTRLTTDTGVPAASTRREVAKALRVIDDPEIKQLLLVLLQDEDADVAEEAMRSLRAMRPLDPLFVPTLVSLLGDRRLKSGARDAIVAYGQPVLPLLHQVLVDSREDLWVRRHIPATVARIPCQQSMDLLVEVLHDSDRFLRDKAIAGMEALLRRDATLSYPREPIDGMLIQETQTYFECLTRRHGVFDRGGMPTESLLAQVLTEKMERAVDRSYRLLTLLHSWKDVATVRWAIERGNAVTRARAFEFLDNILATHLRQSVLPMLEDLPLEEKVERGHRVRRTHPESLEDSMLSLINDTDEVVAAAAIDLVRSERLWNLSSDVEHVLAHRDVRDWLVFEAASWTLAEQRLTPQERQARWLEPLPGIVLADRLRGLSMFSSVQVEEVARLTAGGRQLRHGDQATLLTEGMVPAAFHILLDGRVVAKTRLTEGRSFEGPSLVGFEPALQGAPARETVRARGPIVTVAVSRDDLLTALAGNTDLVRGLLQTIIESLSASRMPTVLTGTARGDLTGIDTDHLTQVQTLLALRQVPIFATLSSDELGQLTAVARAVPTKTGDVLADETAPPCLWVVLSGVLAAVDISDPDVRELATPGDTLSVFETLGGFHSAHDRRARRLVVVESGTALRIEQDELFDLIGQRPGLLQHLFGTLLGHE